MHKGNKIRERERIDTQNNCIVLNKKKLLKDINMLTILSFDSSTHTLNTPQLT